MALALAGCVKDEPYVNPNPTPDPGPVDPVVTKTVFINEVNCGTKEFEIYNATNKAVDIAGYTFTKDDKDPWTVPAGKGNIPAKGFLVFTAKNADAKGLQALHVQERRHLGSQSGGHDGQFRHRGGIQDSRRRKIHRPQD